MKKLLLSVVLIASTLTFTFAQKDYSTWSVSPKVGFDYYRTSPTGGSYSKNMAWTAGVAVERTVNPLFGLGLDLSYNAFNNGGTFDPVVYGSVNLSNLLFPRRESSKWNVYSKVGAGLGFYHNDVKGGDEDGVSPLAMISFNPEYSLNNSWAVGLEVADRLYVKETLGGLTTGNRFNDGVAVSATVRYNFGGDNNLRNVTMEEFYPTPEPVIEQVENKYDDSKLVNRLDNLDRQNQNIQNRLTKLENDLRKLKEQAEGAVINASFQNIEFNFDSAKLTDDSYPVLDKIVSILKSIPTWGALQVNGYTDNIGSKKYNLKLSDARVKTVKDYLVSKGLSADVISVKGYGEANPVASNSTRSGREKNRRVEFQIVKK